MNNGHLDIIKFFIETGTDINEKDVFSKSLLLLAAGTGISKIVKFLVEGGANINDFDQSKNSPLSISIYGGFIDIALYLLQNGAKPDILDCHEQFGFMKTLPFILLQQLACLALLSI